MYTKRIPSFMAVGLMLGLMLIPHMAAQVLTTQVDATEVSSDTTMVDDSILSEFPTAITSAPILAELDSLPVDTLDADQPIEHHLHMEFRNYRDRIVVRWAPDSYVALRMGLLHGYTVGRVDYTVGRYDTLLLCHKPPTKEEFIERFGEQDTSAMAAGQLVYGEQPSFDGSLTFNQIKEEQEGIYAYLMIICDMRPDVAEVLGLAYADSTSVRNHDYGYAIIPIKNDSTFYFPGIQMRGAKLEEFKPEAYPFAPVDSVKAPSTVRLTWPNTWYSTYDIERRKVTVDGEWKRLNELPFLGTPTLMDEEGHPLNLYYDLGVEVGTYEYRIAGYDLFGDRSLPGPVRRVEMPDLVPPSSPLIHSFVVLPGDTLLDIHIAKDSLEDDLRGFRPYYYCNELFGENWVRMTEEMAYPSDTVIQVPIKGYRPGMIAVAAVDQAGNEAFSMPMSFHMPDNIPPQTPKNLRAAVSPEGIVVLFWSPSPDIDVHHYDLYFANDSTHEFVQMPRGELSCDTIAFDTLDLSAMQQFRYYQVQAFDYAGNESPRSPWLQVARPNFKAPQCCQLDSVWQNDEGLYSLWIPSPEPDIKEYCVLRRLENDTIWDIIKILTPDSVRADGRLLVHDSPEANWTRRYEYSIESVNTTGTTSGASLAARYRWHGRQLLPVQIKLGASYREEGVVALAWETAGLTEEYREGGYYIIYRRIEGETDFSEIATVRLDTESYMNYRFPRGVKAEYMMRYQNEDMRFGPFSPVATVKIPKENK